MFEVAQKNNEKRPNFVFIMTDTQGAGAVGAYGYPGLHTPNIDRLAAEGTLFTRAYTTSPVCTPARGGIFTGMYPHINGAWGNDLPLGEGIKTMGQRFKDNGYRTAYIGKWHLDGHDYFGNGICPDGWQEEYWYDGLRYLQDLGEENTTLWRKELGKPQGIKKHDIQAEFTWAYRASQKAEKFLSEKSDEPFLLVVSYDEPHHPSTCPYEYIEKFLDFKYDIGPAAFDTLENKPEHQKMWAAYTARRIKKEKSRYLSNPMYFASNSFVDSEIGKVIDYVDKYAPENTYIIYTSDHGEMFGAHGLRGKGPVMYDEITRIPFIIRQPGKHNAGTINDTLISHVDILPTIMELANLSIPPILDGKSLTKNIIGENKNTDESIVIEYNRYSVDDDDQGAFQPVRCIMKGDFKLVINLHYTDELYNMKDDPAEMNNLIYDERYAEVRGEMHKELMRWMKERRDPFGGFCWENRDWNAQKDFKWNNGLRYRPADGYAPPFRTYSTGRPQEENMEVFNEVID